MEAKYSKKKASQAKSDVPTTPEQAQVLLEKLQTSETKYRRLFETTQDGILLLDAKTGEITDVNPFLLDLLGYPYDEIVGKKLWEIGMFTDEARAGVAFETLRKNRFIRYEDLPLQKASGTRTQVEFVCNVYPVGGRDVIQCQIRDITQRRNVERREAIESDLALAVGELGTWRLDLMTGKSEQSLRFDEIFGYPAPFSEWTYEMFLSHVVAEDRDAVAESFGKALSNKTDWDFTCRIRRQDGEVRWIWAKGKPEFNEQHEPVSLFGLIQDITERAQVEAERDRLLKRQLVINRVTLALGVSADLKSTLRTLRNEIHSLLDADGFFVSRYHKETGLITALFIVDEGVERDVSTFPSIPLAAEGKGMQSSVLRTGQPLNIPNWIERERTMQTVYHIESDGSLSTPPPEDKRVECTKSALLVPMVLEGKPVGVLQVQSNRLNAYSDDDIPLLSGIANVAAVAIENSSLIQNIRAALEGTVQIIGATVEIRDPYTAGHQRRVAELACAVGKDLGLPEAKIDGLRVAGLLHDIGKMSIPAEILSKPTRLTEIEFALIQGHSQVAYDLLKPFQFPWPIAQIVLQHHERMDGSGYPQGLKGEDLLPEAKILAVCDVVEAMVAHRPYRAALGIDAALEEIRLGRGTRYDASVVDACIALFREKGFEFSE